jgi:hypothetical protein
VVKVIFGSAVPLNLSSIDNGLSSGLFYSAQLLVRF